LLVFSGFGDRLQIGKHNDLGRQAKPVLAKQGIADPQPC
jgi:hypothetical protein